MHEHIVSKAYFTLEGPKYWKEGKDNRLFITDLY